MFEAGLEQTMRTWNRWLTLHLKANAQLRPEISKELTALSRKIAKIDELLLNRLSGA